MDYRIAIVMKTLIFLSALFIITSCTTSPKAEDLEEWKEEVAAAEKAFNDMAQNKGLVEAFGHFAAEDGVIRRSKKIVQGKAAIRAWYEQDVRPNETLSWYPTFIDVSQSGDLAYTYGNFTFTYYDSLGKEKKNEGIFHTVWKRQKDGSWKFVWD